MGFLGVFWGLFGAIYLAVFHSSFLFYVEHKIDKSYYHQ